VGCRERAHLRGGRLPGGRHLERGYAADARGLAAFIVRLAATGVAGYNLEDTVAERDLYPLDETNVLVGPKPKS
jgi:hypothetical protein